MVTQVNQILPRNQRTVRISDARPEIDQHLNKKTTSRPGSGQTHDPVNLHKKTSDMLPESPADRTRSQKRKRVYSESEDSDYMSDATPQPQLQPRESRKTSGQSEPRTRRPAASTSRLSLPSTYPSHVSPPSTPSPPTFSLALDRITRTTLLVHLARSPDDFVPLNLRSCMTVATFFASVIGVWEMDEANVERVKVGFEWMPGKTMVMKRSPADVFEWFLKAIDKAPCWDRGEECTVGVEIIEW